MQLGNTCLLGWLKKVIRKDSSQLCHSSGISCRNIMVLCFVISNCTVHLNLSQMAWWNDPVKSMPVCSNMTSISGKEHKGAFGMWAGFMWLSVHMHPNMWPMGSGYWHFTVVPILHWCYCISVNIPIYTLKMCEPDPFESGTECSLNLSCHNVYPLCILIRTLFGAPLTGKRCWKWPVPPPPPMRALIFRSDRVTPCLQHSCSRQAGCSSSKQLDSWQ